MKQGFYNPSCCNLMLLIWSRTYLFKTLIIKVFVFYNGFLFEFIWLKSLVTKQKLRTKSAFTETKSHPGMKVVPGWKNVCLHVSLIPRWNEYNFIRGWNLIWKKTCHWVRWKHNKISHFSQLLKSEAWYVKNIRRLKARCIKWLRLNAWGLQLY